MLVMIQKHDLCPLTPDLFLKEARNSSTQRDLDKIKFPDKTELNKRLLSKETGPFNRASQLYGEQVNKSRKHLILEVKTVESSFSILEGIMFRVIIDSVSTIPVLMLDNVRTQHRYSVNPPNRDRT
ncbi:hypothetical protein TNCV_4752911 [Trichonephila clavipes]|nr:hypothetical protein TNCV_4752911 [Trichonephila clavipes]